MNQTGQSEESIPSASLPIGNIKSPNSYKDRLIQSTPHLYFDNWFERLQAKEQEVDTPDEPSPSDILAVQFDPDEIKSYRQVWNKALIIKLHGRGLNFQGASEKLAQLWKITNPFQVMDIGAGFYIVKFYDFNDYMMVLARGPWFIFNRYLFVHRWKPNFRPTVAKLNSMIVWIQLPVEYYDSNALYKIASLVRTPIKLDVHTCNIHRARYSRICVELDTTNHLSQKFVFRKSSMS